MSLIPNNYYQHNNLMKKERTKVNLRHSSSDYVAVELIAYMNIIKREILNKPLTNILLWEIKGRLQDVMKSLKYYNKNIEYEVEVVQPAFIKGNNTIGCRVRYLIAPDTTFKIIALEI